MIYLSYNSKLVELDDNCGTGAGGFKSGNTCATKRSGILGGNRERLYDIVKKEGLLDKVNKEKIKEYADRMYKEIGTAKIKETYGKTSVGKIQNWLDTDHGNKLKNAVAKSLNYYSKGSIGALEGVYNDKFKIAGTAFASPAILPLVIGESVIGGFFKGVVQEYQKQVGKSAVKEAIKKQGNMSVNIVSKINLEEDPNIEDVIEYLKDVLATSIKDYIFDKKKLNNFENNKCPLPTQDIKTNLANRQKAIDVAHYGPANPKEPNEEYWTAKAKIFGGSVKEAKTMRCGNCAGFNQTSKLTDCISKGIGSDAQEVEQAGDLGYCEIFDFKCASLRTCDAWIVGGPITDNTNLEQLKADLLSLKEQGATLLYDPSQARDQSGKWTSEGGQIMVSPNIKENMNYEEASKMLTSPEQARAVSIAKDLIDKQKISGKIESAIGDWEDGAENSVKIDVKGIKDFEQLAYTASKLGAMLNQKAVVAFQKKKDGPDILHKITADKPMDQVRKILSDNGISFRTMVGDRAKTSVTILDKGSQLTANVAKFLGAINGKSEAVRGIGEFIGGDTRIAGKKAYKGVIDNYERSFPNRVHLGLQRGRGRNYYRSYQAINFYDPSQPRDESGKWSKAEAVISGILNKGWEKIGGPLYEKQFPEGKVTAELKPWFNKDELRISHIETEQKARGKGIGSKALKDITDSADKIGAKIIGGVKPTGGSGLTKSQLFKWYEKHGFYRKPYIGNPSVKSDEIERKPKGDLSFEKTEFYDPSQKRDKSGKWTDDGGIAEGATPTPRWAQDNPAEASKKTGEATTLYHGTSADVLKNIRKEGLKPSKSGVWGGGKVYSTDSLDLAMEYGVLRSGNAPKIGGKQLIGIISVLAEGFKSVADNIPTTKAQKMGKTGLAAVSKIFTKDGGVAPSAIKKMQIFEVDAIRKYVYENGPKPSPLATKELAEGSQLIYVPIVIQLPDDGSEGFQFDESVAIESFVFQYNGEKIEFYDPNQPRDEKGRWSGGGGIKSAKASTKAKQVSETSESKDGEDVDTMVKRLENEPKAKKAIADMNKLRQQTADREGISFDDASVTRWSLRDPSRYKQSKDIVETLRNPTPHHREWINQQVKEGLNPNAKSDNPVAVILMGSPASGKTTTGRPFAEKILGGQQVTVIDPDSIKAKSHGFQGWNAGAFHDESAIIAEKMIMPRATQERHNMLIDITGQNSTKVSEMAKNLKALGYTIGVVHIDVNDKTALGRASQRFNKPNGRWVPYSYIKGASEKARNTWNKLTKENLIDIGYQVDGNVSRTKGEAPVKETYGKIFE